jgi:glycosyltransferase involved in cell wall biosynthesis
VWQVLDLGTPRPLRRPLTRFAERTGDALMFAGDALRREHLGSRRARVPSVVFYPPVDTGLFRPDAVARSEVRAELGIPDGAPVVGALANLTPAKGLEQLVRAAGPINAERPDAWFVVVGERFATHAGYEDRLLAELRATGVPRERLVLAGPRADPQRYLAAFDVKLLTSPAEGAPTTVIEAMACGVAVVATDVGSVRELVVDGESGLVVQPGDPRELARETLRLLGDDELRARVGGAARARAVERFDTRASADAHARAFEAAVARHAR